MNWDSKTNINSMFYTVKRIKTRTRKAINVNSVMNIANVKKKIF